MKSIIKILKLLINIKYLYQIYIINFKMSCETKKRVANKDIHLK